MTTEHDDRNFEPAQAASPTDRVLAELQLYGYRPFHDEPDPRPLPEIGAAWPKRSNEGRDYLSLKLDDPSFTAPIYANLFDDEEGDGYSLIWSRGRKANGD